jgi:hypothetical protein
MAKYGGFGGGRGGQSRLVISSFQGLCAAFELNSSILLAFDCPLASSTILYIVSFSPYILKPQSLTNADSLRYSQDFESKHFSFRPSASP